MSAPEPFTVKTPFANDALPAAPVLPMSWSVHGDGNPPGGGALATVAVAAFDVVVAPELSVATAVIEYVPAATFVHDALYGLDVTVPINVAPL